MAYNPYPNAPVKKKRAGMGCFGCGCLVLVLIVVLLAALVGGSVYMGYKGLSKLSTTTPPAIPTFDGGDDVFNRARQKTADFSHDVQNYQGATLHLTADEINTLLARRPEIKAKNVKLFVSINNNQAQLQWGFPLSNLQLGVLQDRYLSGDVTLMLNFDPGTRHLHFILQDAHCGGTEFPSQYLPLLQQQLDTAVNTQLQADADVRKLINQTKSIEFKNGELVIQTQ